MPRILRASVLCHLQSASSLFFARQLFILAMLACSPNWAAAEPANQPIVHIIRSGDTLYGLAKRYLKNAARWPEIARNNPNLVPRRLRPGESVRIFGTAQQMLEAIVLHAGGIVRVYHEGEPPAVVAEGEKLREGDKLEVSRRGYAALQLGDGSIVRLRENTTLTLQQMRGENGQPEKKSAVGLYLSQGRVEAEVKPRPDGSRYEVRTPLAIAGVRGTQFGVSLAPPQEGLLVDVIHGSVVVKSLLTKESVLLTPQQGASLKRNQSSLAVATLLPAPDLSAIPKSVGQDPMAIALDPMVGASNYELVLAEDAKFNRVLETHMTAEPTRRTATLDEGDYYLSVRAIDQDGGYGTPSRIRVTVGPLPEAPFQVNPPHGATIQEFSSFTLACAELLDATAYKFQLSRSPDFRQLLQEEQISGHCNLQENRQLPPGKYYWRVAAVSRRADGHEMIGNFGAISAFERIAAPLAQGVQPLPTIAALRWTETAGVRYRLQISANTTFASVLRELQSVAPQAEIKGLPAGEYFARLKVIDSYGIESGYSAPQRFRIGDLQPNHNNPLSHPGPGPTRQAS